MNAPRTTERPEECIFTMRFITETDREEHIGWVFRYNYIDREKERRERCTLGVDVVSL